MKQSTKRFVSMLLSLMLLTGAIVVFAQFIRPEYATLQKMRSELSGRTQFVADQGKAIQQVQSLIATYQQQGQLRDAISSALPLNPDVAGALTQLNGIALANRLTAQSFSVATPGIQENEAARAAGAQNIVRPIGTVTFQVKMLSGYQDFKSFLRMLESNIRIFDMKNLVIQPADRPDRDLYVYDFTVATYYQVEQ